MIRQMYFIQWTKVICHKRRIEMCVCMFACGSGPCWISVRSAVSIYVTEKKHSFILLLTLKPFYHLSTVTTGISTISYEYFRLANILIHCLGHLTHALSYLRALPKLAEHIRNRPRDTDLLAGWYSSLHAVHSNDTLASGNLPLVSAKQSPNG